VSEPPVDVGTANAHRIYRAVSFPSCLTRPQAASSDPVAIALQKVRGRLSTMAILYGCRRRGGCGVRSTIEGYGAVSLTVSLASRR
jgi:hypothetical protein